MNMLILPILYILSGFFMKFSDDFYDENNQKAIACILGIVCGVATALASIISFDAACIFIAILVANILALKVDGIHHIITMLSFLIVFVIGIILTPYNFSFTFITLVVLVASIIGAYIDEIGNDSKKIYALGKPFEIFFEYRCGLKVVLLILVLIGYLNVWSFIFFIFFELSYEFARIVFEKIYL